VSDEHRSRLGLLTLVAALIVGTAGFFSGVLRDVEPQGYVTAPPPDEASGAHDARLAPTQDQLAAAPHGPNRERLAKNWARLAGQRRSPTDDIGRPTDAEWDEAMAARREHRAFNGAPPVVPHSIEQQSFPTCLSCHLDGLVIEDRTAPAMSHEPMDNCTQCHVTAEPSGPGIELAGALPQENTFEGVHRGGRGSRSGAGAPPTIPHSTFMRERCESCHGVLATGLRTSHACQQNCLQCHGPSAAFDQIPSTAPPTIPQQ
jgi:cytochrome c-type protein NapB